MVAEGLLTHNAYLEKTHLRLLFHKHNLDKSILEP